MEDKDKIVNFYKILPNKHKLRLQPSFKNHHIKPNSRIGLIGCSGSGKTNALINFLLRTSGDYSQIIICSFSTVNEPLYAMIRDKNEEVQFIDDIEDIPDLSEFEDDKDTPKLIVFDDFIHLNRKQMEKINKYFISSRKFGFTCFALAQDFVSLPKVISRNINYYMLFKINDNISIDHIIRTHNITNIEKDKLKLLYKTITSEPMNFMLIDVVDGKIRRNFLEYII